MRVGVRACTFLLCPACRQLPSPAHTPSLIDDMYASPPQPQVKPYLRGVCAAEVNATTSAKTFVRQVGTQRIR